jgi:hypothetical protein
MANKLFSFSVEATVAQNNTTLVDDIQLPSPGFLLFRIVPIVYRATVGKITSDTLAQEELLITIRDKASGEYYTRGAVPIWSFEDIERSQNGVVPWLGQYFPANHQLTMEFQRTNKLNLHADAYYVRLVLQGYKQQYSNYHADQGAP